MTTYTPAPGTVAFRVIGWLEEQGAAKEFNASQIANALDLDPKTITTCLQNALDTGLVFRRQKDRSHPRAPFWYSLTNHGVLQRAWTPNPVDWMQRPTDVPDGVVTSSAPRAADGAPSGEGPAAADAPRARAAESTDAKFALFCDGELMVSCGGTVIQLKAEHVQRLRRLLGGAYGNEQPATVYHCLFCGEWHIGGKRPVDQTATYKRKRAALLRGQED